LDELARAFSGTNTILYDYSKLSDEQLIAHEVIKRYGG
jgi:hypothetical protein